MAQRVGGFGGLVKAAHQAPLLLRRIGRSPGVQAGERSGFQDAPGRCMRRAYPRSHVKNLLAFILALAAVVAGGLVMVFQQKGRADQFDVEREIALINAQTMRQVSLIAHSPDDKFPYDRSQVVRKHVEAVNELRKKYPEALKEGAFIERMEAAAREGAKDKAKTAEYRARYDYVKEMWEAYMKNGNFKPLFAGVSSGLRFEVASIKKSNDGGSEGLRWDVFIYGVPPKDQLALNNFHVDTWVEFDDKETSGKRKGQNKRAVYKADLQPFLPYILVDKPWEWMPEWPAGVMVGYYVGIPQWDSRATTMDASLNGQLRTLGGTILPIDIKWKKMAVDGAWKGVKGGKWDDPNLVPLSDEDLKEQGVVLPEEEEAAAKAAEEKK